MKFRTFFLAGFLLLFTTVLPAFAAPLSLDYQLSGSGNVQPRDWQIRLEFDQPVSSLEISQNINLEFNERNTKFEFHNSTELGDREQKKALPSERKIFIIKPSKVPEKPGNYRLIINKGLSADNNAKLKRKKTIEFSTVSGTTLLGFEPYFQSPKNKGVYIYLSDKIRDHLLKKKIKIFPPVGRFQVDRRYSRNRNKYRIYGKFITGQRYKISIEGGSVGDKKHVLNPDNFSFVSCGPDPEIRFAADRSVIELKSRQLLPLSFANTGDFKCQLMRVPPLFAPWLDSLTIFPQVEEQRDNEFTSFRVKGSTRKALEKSAEQLDNLMLDCVNRNKAIKELSKLQTIPGIENFLRPDFSSTSEGFIGSKDPDKEYYFALPLDIRPEPEKGGSVVIKLTENQKKNGQQATRLFQVTDLSITYKFSRKNLIIWLTSMHSGEPVANVPLMIMLKDDVTLFPGKTDKDGLITISADSSYPAIKWKDNNPEITSKKGEISDMLIAAAATKDDSCFVRLNTNRLIPSSVNSAYIDKSSNLGAKAHIFTERGVYRPAETVFWKATLRNFARNEIRALDSEQVKIKIYNPRGEEVYGKTHRLNDFGTASDSFALKSYSPLGRYDIKLYLLSENTTKAAEGLSPEWDFLMNRKPSKLISKNKNIMKSAKVETFLNSTGFQVQEFQPPRHYVEIENKLEERMVETIVGQKNKMPYLKCTVKSRYYAGGPLRHAKVQWQAHLKECDTKIADYPLFQFGNNEESKDLIEAGNSVLDKNGNLVISIPVSQEVLSGTKSIQIAATVLDVDSRPATGINSFEHTPDYRVGIGKLPPIINQGQELPLEVITLDKEGRKIQNGKIKLDIMKQKWFYTQKRNQSGEVYYHWSNGWLRSQSLTGEIKNGKATFDLVLPEGGNYLIEAAYENSQGIFKSTYSFYVQGSYSRFRDYNNDSRKRSENEIALLADKQVAKINNKVKIRYSLPSPADYALLTMETDEILSAEVIKVGKSHGSLEKVIGKDCRPNVYISLTAPSRRGDFPIYTSQVDKNYPKTYFGFTNIKVKNKIEKLSLKIAPDKPEELKALPGESVEINLEIKNQDMQPTEAEVAVCVVDEAVLSLTGFVTPALDSLTDFILPLKVFSGDLRTSLISQELFELIGVKELTGGDGGTGNINADFDLRQDFRPVAFWAPALYPDKQGKITINFKAPDSMTSYRIYAVAADKHSAFATTDRQLLISKDFYIEPGLPNFLTAGDKAVFPLSLKNKTNFSGIADYRIEKAENLSMTPMKGQVELQAFTNSTSKIQMNADNGCQKSSIIFSGNFKGMQDRIKQTLTINPATTIINRYSSGHFTKSTRIKPDLPKYVSNLSEPKKQGTISARLQLSASKWSKIVPAIGYLLKYPYGCIEQTCSAIIPLIAIRELIDQGYLQAYAHTPVDDFIENGIERILGMQQPSGGFSYWPGSSNISWWGSQYAVLALSMAKKAGFTIDQDRIDKAVKFTRNGLFGNNNENNYRRGIMALAAVNLAMNQTLKEADLDVIGKGFSDKETEALPLLILARTLNGKTDKMQLHAMLKRLKPANKSVTHSWYYSSTRENAFALMAILEAGGDIKQADQFAGEILDNITEKGYWNSTADTGFALLALSKYFKRTQIKESKKNIEVSITTSKGSFAKKVNKYGATIELSSEELINPDGLKITCSDDVLLNWSLDYNYPDHENRQEKVNKGFNISKTLTNLNGEEDIKVGDLVKVTVIFEDKFNFDDKHRILHYLALEDPVPAGFIPVNTSLKNDSLPASELDNEQAYCSWENGSYRFYANHQEMHDDKVLAFKNRLWSGSFRLEYYLRAVCEGRFKMKPTHVSLMYNPEIYGMTIAKEIEIKGSR
ncbi:MAG: alpha-2-macroglobulin family protein [Candidatus Rifleibacteriota bacterium]